MASPNEDATDVNVFLKATGYESVYKFYFIIPLMILLLGKH
jgi:hypothetical protein